MKLLFSILSGLFFICPVFSQDCEVLTASIQGKYAGDCKGKKANGAGKAEGTDTYEGNFKNGYPSGLGTYTYRNGDFYKGIFKKGEKEGKGEFHYIKKGSEDSIIKGFWKDDVYVGAYLQPYTIGAKSESIDRLDVRAEGGVPKMLTIISENTMKGTNLSNVAAPLPVIKYFNVDEGTYIREERRSTAKTSTLILHGLTYPFHIRINYNDQSFDVLLSQDQPWTIYAQVGERR